MVGKDNIPLNVRSRVLTTRITELVYEPRPIIILKLTSRSILTVTSGRTIGYCTLYFFRSKHKTGVHSSFFNLRNYNVCNMQIRVTYVTHIKCAMIAFNG